MEWCLIVLQMFPMMIRYRKSIEEPYNGKVEIKELFLVFFHIKRKKAIDIKQEILQRLELDGLSINDCLTLGYDNVATMSGIHGGAQALTKNIDK